MHILVYSGSSSFPLRNRHAMLWSVSRDGPCYQLPQSTLSARTHCCTPWFTRSLSLRCLWCQSWTFWEKVNFHVICCLFIMSCVGPLSLCIISVSCLYCLFLCSHVSCLCLLTLSLVYCLSRLSCCSCH